MLQSESLLKKFTRLNLKLSLQYKKKKKKTLFRGFDLTMTTRCQRFCPDHDSVIKKEREQSDVNTL